MWLNTLVPFSSIPCFITCNISSTAELSTIHPCKRITTATSFLFTLDLQTSLTMVMVVLHFVKREFETLFIHRFSADTMPLAYIVRNSAHYWALCGIIFGYIVNHPHFSTVHRTETQTNITLLLYTFFELSNLYTHITLRRLRPEGSRTRQIPRGYGFDWPFGGLSFPNYYFDFMAWVVVGVWSWCWGILPFLAVAVFMMDRWAQQVSLTIFSAG